MDHKTKRSRLMRILASMKDQLSSENPEDRLSSLHESVLSRILTRLPTKEAIRTSVLSKRWRDMWTNITDLEFDDRKQRGPGENQFVELVEHALLGVGSPQIHSFCLRSSNSYDESLISSWISAVLKRNLKRLVITWYELESFNFSPFFDSFGSLVELRLRMKSILDISAPVHLPNLKFLSLEDARIFNMSSVSDQLLLRFPALETFEASYCRCFKTSTIVIDSPSLKLFEMAECSFEHIPGDSGKCGIRVLAPSLEKITYSGDLSKKFSLSFPSSLPDAYLGLGKWHASSRFPKSFSCLRSLGLELCNEFQWARLPKFKQLVYLHLIYDVTQHHLLMKFLYCTPMLEMLSIRDQISVNSKPSKPLFLYKVPDCVKSTLRVIQIRNFSTGRRQLTLVRYFIEKAEVLGPVVLCSPKRQEVPEEVQAQVMSYPKASSDVCVFVE